MPRTLGAAPTLRVRPTSCGIRPDGAVAQMAANVAAASTRVTPPAETMKL